MPEIQYKDLDHYLKDLKENKKAKGVAPVFLLYGEALLYKNALEILLNALLPEKNRSFNYDALDGTNCRIEEVVERINTYSLLAETKVVAVCRLQYFLHKTE